MANNLTDYLENKLLDHAFGKAAYTMPTTVYVGLFTAAPGEAAGGTEVTGGAYVRKAIAVNVAAAGATTNSAEMLWDVATANWGTLTHLAIFDAATAGNMLWYGPLAATKVINNTDQFKLPAASVTVSLD
jgi:hypothetical protein